MSKPAKLFSLDDVLAQQSEKFELGGRTFTARPLSLGESIRLDAAGEDLDLQIEALSAFLTLRSVDGKPVEKAWLGDHLTHATGSLLVTILRTGRTPEQEEKSPKVKSSARKSR